MLELVEGLDDVPNGGPIIVLPLVVERGVLVVNELVVPPAAEDCSTTVMFDD